MKARTIIASSMLVALTMACEERTEDTTRQPAPREAERTEEHGDALEERAEERAERREKRLDEEAEKKADKEEEAKTASNGAMSHLPADCQAVARIDMAKLLELPGAKEHVVSALEKTANQSESRLGQVNSVLEEMGVEPTKDVKEVALCAKELPAQGKLADANLVVAVSGDFPSDKLVSTLMERGKGNVEKVQVNGAEAVHDTKRDVFVGQTDDGTVIAARSRDAFDKAVSNGDARGDYKLPDDTAVSLMLPSQAIERILEASKDAGLKKLLTDAKRATLVLDASGTTLTLRVEMPDEQSASELGGAMKASLERMRSQPSNQQAFGKHLDRADVSYDGAATVLEMKVPKEQVEALMRDLAAEIRTHMG